MATVLVTGVTGQLGFYAAEQLSRRGDVVWGLIRQSTLGRQGVGEGALPYRPITGDLLDEYSLLSILEEVRPALIFNFGAQSFVPSSWTQPILTAQYTGLGVVRLLEAVRRVVPECRVLQAGSSELFAGADRSPQDESSAISPRNPYGIAKAFAYYTVQAYRSRYGQFASNVVFFTNESRRRSPEFLFRKVTRGVAAIVAGQAEHLKLGNLDTVRDWGYSPEYAALSIALLEGAPPGDFLIATGKGWSVRALVSRAFELVGLDWQKYVRVDEGLIRQSEQVPLIGDSTKLRLTLGRSPVIDAEGVLRIVLAYDLAEVGRGVPFESPAPLELGAG